MKSFPNNFINVKPQIYLYTILLKMRKQINKHQQIIRQNAVSLIIHTFPIE